MNILWFTWKDLKNPLAGGAEVVNEEIAKRLVSNGHEVKILVGGFYCAKPKEIIDGYEVIRVGNRWSVYWQAYKYFKKNLRDWPDLIIEEVNTIPFFTQFYSKSNRIILFHQLCREVWFFEMSPPLSWLGFGLESVYLRILNKNKVLTISASSKTDLQRFGFDGDKISIFQLGCEVSPAKDPEEIKKYRRPTLLSLGSIRNMKRTIDQIKAFEITKKEIPELQMKIAGEGKGKYFRKVIGAIDNSKYKKDIEYLGRVSKEKKLELMQKSHLIAVTSVKEGWGLIVTEAATQGTPAVVYNVDGLRDSVKNGKTGIVSGNVPEDLAKSIVELLQDDKKYRHFSNNAHRESKKYTFDNMYISFVNKAGIR